MTPEGQVKRKIDAWLDRNMPEHWRYKPRGGPYGVAGTPDYLICWLGIFIAFEVKADDDKDLTGLQRQRLLEIQAAGGVAAMVRGYDIARLEAIKQAALRKAQSCNSQSIPGPHEKG